MISSKTTKIKTRSKQRDKQSQTTNDEIVIGWRYHYLEMVDAR